jgi:hypothetical protein
LVNEEFEKLLAYIAPFQGGGLAAKKSGIPNLKIAVSRSQSCNRPENDIHKFIQ